METKLARQLVRVMVNFLRDPDNEDLAVNGLDRRNRERLIRAVACELAAANQPIVYEHEPVCPNCGSSDVREWGKVSTSYCVGTISSDGTVETTDSSDTAWDSYEYDELMCRDCDFQHTDPKAFLQGTDSHESLARVLKA